MLVPKVLVVRSFSSTSRPPSAAEPCLVLVLGGEDTSRASGRFGRRYRWATEFRRKHATPVDADSEWLRRCITTSTSTLTTPDSTNAVTIVSEKPDGARLRSMNPERMVGRETPLE